MRWLPLFAVLLASCAQLPADCNRGALRELRTVNRLVEETRLNLARGYTYERVESRLRAGFVICTGEDRVRFCTDNRSYNRLRPVAIDPAAEQRSLDYLLARRTRLLELAAACRPSG